MSDRTGQRRSPRVEPVTPWAWPNSTDLTYRAVGADVAVPAPYPEEFRVDVMRQADNRDDGVPVRQTANPNRNAEA